jgi:uncharacterized repeat protein (TIGR01451 family)
MNVNQLDTTCPAILSVKQLTFFNNGYNNFIGLQYFDSLLTLTCNGLGLDTLPPLPPLLTTLNCASNNLRFLSPLPIYLQTLYCADNDLEALPVLPSNLKSLIIYKNNLPQIPALPSGLTTLGCSNNQLTEIPTLPSTLKLLTCDYNMISELPVLPDSLNLLRFSNNPISILPELPRQLTILEFNNTLVSVIPPFNASIKQMRCKNTPISALPFFPPSLRTVDCTGSARLEYVPPILYKMDSLILKNTGLKYLPFLPDTLIHIDLSNDSFLTCLPKINYARYLNTTGTSIQCRQPGGTVNTSTPNYYNLAVCANDTGDCIMTWDIAGRSFFDENLNCNFDTTDYYIQNRKYTLWKDNSLVSSFISDNGQFYFQTPTTGIYEVRVDTTGNTFSLYCPQSATYIDTINTLGTRTLKNDFSFKCNDEYDYKVLSIIGPNIFRPANLANVIFVAGESLSLYNGRCGADQAGLVTVTMHGDAQYIAPMPNALVPSSIVGNTIKWEVPNMSDINSDNPFGITIRVDTSAQIGSTICFVVKIDAVTGERDTVNNVRVHCFTIRNSYDPNDKQVSPVADIDTAQEWLTYTVRFQNTGTAEAQHIYVMDTLDENLDLSSLELLDYSHRPMNVQVKENALRFNFPYINLPDSNTNEPASHGYVQYKVKLKEGLPLGTTIQNTAYIYFDFNEPVVTNTTTNTIALPQDTTGVGISTIAGDVSLSIYPNPAHTNLTIATNHSGNTVAIYNAQGSIVMKQTMNGSAETLNIAELAGGVYYVEVSTTQGIARKKFIKL